MSSQDILNVVLIIGILVFVGAISLIAFFLIKALKAITNLAESLEDTTQNIKEKLQLKALAVIPPILIGLVSRIFKRGRG